MSSNTTPVKAQWAGSCPSCHRRYNAGEDILRDFDSNRFGHASCILRDARLNLEQGQDDEELEVGRQRAAEARAAAQTVRCPKCGSPESAPCRERGSVRELNHAERVRAYKRRVALDSR